MTVVDRIRARYQEMSPTERRIASHLMQHGRVMTFASASQMARMLGLSASTIVRFAQLLGFSGYVELQERLQQEYDQSRQLVGVAVDREDWLENLIQRDSENVAGVGQIEKALAEAGKAMATAAQVWLAGGRSSGDLASIGSHFLNLVRPGVRLLRPGASDLPDQLLDMGERDVLVVVSMSRYTHDVVRLVELAPPRAGTVLLTDEHASPLLPMADWTLSFGTRPAAMFRSLTAAMTTLQALVAVTAREIGPEVVAARIAKAEALWARFGTFAPTAEEGEAMQAALEAEFEEGLAQGPA